MLEVLPARSRQGAATRRRLFTGLAFISPWIAGFALFQLYPIAMSFYYSLTNYDAIRPPHFIGWSNYSEMFSDGLFQTALGNTLFFVGLAVPGNVILAFLLASLLNQRLVFRPFWRLLFYIPAIVPEFVSALLWTTLYDPRSGLIDSVFASLGLHSIPWLGDPSWAKPALIIIYIWTCGANMIIFLAALQDVPRELYESARIDGASARQLLWHITVPLVSPAFLFTLLIGMVYAVQYFTIPQIMTQGEPANSTLFYGMYLYQTGFTYLRLGLACAAAWVLFLIVVVCGLVVFCTSARHIYYGGEAL